MKKNILCVAILFALANTSIAQKKEEQKYKDRAIEVQKEIWDNPDKAFEVKDIPEKYKNESAVIIAKKYEASNSRKSKFNVMSLFGNKLKESTYFKTLRERVLIQDKSALEEFSTVSYQKIENLNPNVPRLFGKYGSSIKTFVGAKVFKANGKINTINVDEEEVLTKNTDKDKQGRLAIPDLQVGDILEYYLHTEEVINDVNNYYSADTRKPDVYFLAGDYPILQYHVKYDLDKKTGVDVLNLNGAPPVAQNVNEDDDILLEFTANDLPKIKGTIWTSLPRQIPYYIIRYGFSGTSTFAKPGKVINGPFDEKILTNLENIVRQLSISKQFDLSAEQSMIKYFGGKKATNKMPQDSIVNFLYNYYKWSYYANFFNLEVSNDLNYKDMEWGKCAIQFSQILRHYGIGNEVDIACSRYSSRLKDILGMGDLEVFIQVNSGGKLKWFCFNDFFQTPGQLFANFEGENAKVLYTLEDNSGKIHYDDGNTIVKLPVTKSSENLLNENLQVNFNNDNFQIITINRFIKETGIMKQGDQKRLLLADEVRSQFAGSVSEKTTREIWADVKSKKDQAKGEEIIQALDKEKQNQKEYFKKEIKDQYDQEAKELLSYKIINTGLTIAKPQFEFNESFTLENFVKKAGNNYIFEVGKLMGSYTKVDEKLRTRALDIYMSCARTLNYTFTVTIPDGYNVKGVEELNKKIENDLASFISTATVNSNTVTITVTRIYNNNFEPAANWPKLLAVMDAAADFTTNKILLEKKK